MEFVTIFIIFLLILSLISISTFQRIVEIKEKNNEIEVNRLLNELWRRILVVMYTGNGTTYKFTLPQKISGTDYKIYTLNDTIIIEIGEKNYTKMLVTQVEGSFKKGLNLIKNVGKVVIN